MKQLILLRGVLLAIGLSAVAQGADDSCKVLFDAQKKVILTAHHIYQTRTVPGKAPEASESITTGGPNGAIYVIVKGTWLRSPMGPSEMLKQEEENIQGSKTSCRYLRDEGGAAVYAVHFDDGDTKADGTVWVDKSKGLPTRDEMDYDMGSGKMHSTVRYDYSNVRAPEGVK